MPAGNALASARITLVVALSMFPLSVVTFVPASIAGEPVSNVSVRVVPPLLASEPSLGSPLRAGEQEPSITKLFLLMPMVAELQSVPLLGYEEFAMMVLEKFRVPALLMPAPAPLLKLTFA